MSKVVKLYDLIKYHTDEVWLAGNCECGERKYDLISKLGVFPPVHESTIKKVKPELLDVTTGAGHKGRKSTGILSSVRMTQRSKFTRRARRYLAYKNQVGWIARQHMQGQPTGEPVELNATFYIHGNRRGDLDNLYKSIADGLNKIVYEDDRQVISMNARLISCPYNEQRVEVRVHEIEGVQ